MVDETLNEGIVQSASRLVIRTASSLVNSNDAWATVIANVAPLATLVGEKNFKAYIKGCTHWTQYALYSCAPIGALSAVVSVLRLVGNDLVKKVIGRQHERRSDVYLDITSTSEGLGLVGQEYRDGVVEQTEHPSPEREANFVMRGSTVSSGSRTSPLQALFTKNKNHFGSLNRVRKGAIAIRELTQSLSPRVVVMAVYPSGNTQDDSVIPLFGDQNFAMSQLLSQWKVKAVPNITSKSRSPTWESGHLLAREIVQYAVSTEQDSLWRMPNNENEFHWIPQVARPQSPFDSFKRDLQISMALGFEVHCTGVSAILTLGKGSNGVQKFGLILCTAILYSSFLLTLVFGNRDQPLANILFAVIGHATVAVGMMVLIWTIKYATVDTAIDVSGLTTAAAFASKSQYSSNIYTNLARVYRSEIRYQLGYRGDKWPNRSRLTKSQHYGIGYLSALLVTVGFVFMYLGLRQLRWWTILICAIISASAAILRSSLTGIRRPGLPALENELLRFTLREGDTYSSFGFFPFTKSESDCNRGEDRAEPFESWSFWGPWSLKNSYSTVSNTRNITLGSKLEPYAIVAMVRPPTLEALEEEPEILTCLAFKIANALIDQTCLLTFHTLRAKKSGPFLLPIIVCVGKMYFRADSFFSVDRVDNIISQHGIPGLLTAFFAMRRALVGVKLHQVSGSQKGDTDLLGQRIYSFFTFRGGLDYWNRLLPRTQSEVDEEILRGIESRRLGGALAFDIDARALRAWLPHLVVWLLLVVDHSELKNISSSLRDCRFGTLPEEIAKYLDMNQSLWFGKQDDGRKFIGEGRTPHRASWRSRKTTQCRRYPAEWP